MDIAARVTGLMEASEAGAVGGSVVVDASL